MITLFSALLAYIGWPGVLICLAACFLFRHTWGEREAESILTEAEEAMHSNTTIGNMADSAHVVVPRSIKGATVMIIVFALIFLGCAALTAFDGMLQAGGM